MLQLPEFRNEPYLDFTQPQNRKAMEQAMEKVLDRQSSEVGQSFET